MIDTKIDYINKDTGQKWIKEIWEILASLSGIITNPTSPSIDSRKLSTITFLLSDQYLM